MTGRDHNVDDAYALETPEDSVRYYRDWAKDYDRDFAEGHGYVYPERVARAFIEAAAPGLEPVLDVGAGTGLVAQHLDRTVDGIDISADMLAVSREKGLYRDLIEADLTRPLKIADATYGGMVSAGTFTHGHVGPVVLPELLRIAKTNALFVFGINAQVFDGAGFGSAFARLVADGRITPLDFREVRVYDRDDHPHGQDRALIALFRKTE